MANVNVKFNNKDYLLSCDDGQENSLKKLTNLEKNQIDEEIIELKKKKNYFQKLLSERNILLELIIDEFLILKKNYNVKRKTVIKVLSSLKNPLIRQKNAIKEFRVRNDESANAKLNPSKICLCSRIAAFPKPTKAQLIVRSIAKYLSSRIKQNIFRIR